MSDALALINQMRFMTSKYRDTRVKKQEALNQTAQHIAQREHQIQGLRNAFERISGDVQAYSPIIEAFQKQITDGERELAELHRVGEQQTNELQQFDQQHAKCNDIQGASEEQIKQYEAKESEIVDIEREIERLKTRLVEIRHEQQQICNTIKSAYENMRPQRPQQQPQQQQPQRPQPMQPPRQPEPPRPETPSAPAPRSHPPDTPGGPVYHMAAPASPDRQPATPGTRSPRSPPAATKRPPAKKPKLTLVQKKPGVNVSSAVQKAAIQEMGLIMDSAEEEPEEGIPVVIPRDEIEEQIKDKDESLESDLESP